MWTMPLWSLLLIPSPSFWILHYIHSLWFWKTITLAMKWFLVLPKNIRTIIITIIEVDGSNDCTNTIEQKEFWRNSRRMLYMFLYVFHSFRWIWTSFWLVWILKSICPCQMMSFIWRISSKTASRLSIILYYWRRISLMYSLYIE